MLHEKYSVKSHYFNPSIILKQFLIILSFNNVQVIIVQFFPVIYGVQKTSSVSEIAFSVVHFYMEGFLINLFFFTCKYIFSFIWVEVT
jgi:hypothetical protein